jgi:hypothetical protein
MSRVVLDRICDMYLLIIVWISGAWKYCIFGKYSCALLSLFVMEHT